jgi:enamine deaminase RidA (YjgF/YER057c/UK114 family)
VTGRQAYAPGIAISGDLDILYFSDFSAYPADIDPWNPGAFRLPSDIDAQNRMLTENIDRTLAGAGITWQHIVKTVATRAELGGGSYMQEKMRGWYPCSVGLQVVNTGVADAKVLFNITAVAPRKTELQGPSRLEPLLPQTSVIRNRISFAPGIRVSSDMDLIYFAEFTAYPPEVDPWDSGSFTLPVDANRQNRMAIDNIERMLTAAGVRWQDVVMVKAYFAEVGGVDYLQDKMGDWRACGSIRVTSIGIPGVKVRYEITAAAPRANTAVAHTASPPSRA